MTAYYLFGVPVPMEEELFHNDKKLVLKLKKISDFVEIKNDMREAKEAIDALAFSYGKEEEMGKIFGRTFSIPRESLLSFAAVSYAKAFNESKGRTSLRDKLDQIFLNEDLLKDHEDFINIRNEVYAHRESDHNKYHVMCSYYDDKIQLQPDSSVRRRLFAYVLQKEDVAPIVKLFETVINYLESNINSLCKNIENEFSSEQINFIKKLPRSHLVN